MAIEAALTASATHVTNVPALCAISSGGVVGCATLTCCKTTGVSRVKPGACLAGGKAVGTRNTSAPCGGGEDGGEEEGGQGEAEHGEGAWGSAGPLAWRGRSQGVGEAGDRGSQEKSAVMGLPLSAMVKGRPDGEMTTWSTGRPRA